MIQPVGNKVLLEVIEETTRSGFYIPDNCTDPRMGIVVAIGNGRKTKKGNLIPIEGLAVGDKVLVGDTDKIWMELEGKRHWMTAPENILGALDAA